MSISTPPRSNGRSEDGPELATLSRERSQQPLKKQLFSTNHANHSGRYTQSAEVTRSINSHETEEAQGPNLVARPSSSQPAKEVVELTRRQDAQPKGNAALTNGVATLSIRQSPKPSRPGTNNVTAIKRKSRSPTIVDKDQDFEADYKGRTTKHSRHGSPTWDDDLTDLSKWTNIKPSAPIHFDASSTHKGHKNNNVSSTTSESKAVGTREVVNNRQPMSTHSRPSPPKTNRPPAPVQIVVPPTPSQQNAQHNQLLRRIQGHNGYRYFLEHPQEVVDFAGNGVLTNTHTQIQVPARAKQKKLKGKVNRSEVELDFGTPTMPEIFEVATSMEIIQPRTAARRILKARFDGDHPAKLQFNNQLYGRFLNGKFQFVSDFVRSRKVRARKQAPLESRSCTCSDGCQRDCACGFVQEKANSKLRQVTGLQPYHRRSDKLVTLSETFLNIWPSKHMVIYECGEECGCDENTCVNRVVQKGRKVGLEVFETKYCGFGVKTLENIVRGQFIDLYLGEVLTIPEVERREDAAEEDTPSYFMELDVFTAEGSDATKLVIDGANFGSVTRFVNHSCEPNAKTLPVVLQTDTKHLYHVAFFAVKDIPKGTEITIDYDPDLNALEDDTLDDAVVQCRCGSENCRKRLWAPSKQKRARKRVLPLKDDD